jgi:hypothetical protein
MDGELDQAESDELRSHAESCDRCCAELQNLEAAAAHWDRALRILDVEPDLNMARRRIQARKLPGSPRPSFFTSWSLPKAASVALLLTGFAATALPGSPVRRWLKDGWQAFTESTRDEPVETPSEPGPGDLPATSNEQGPEEAGAGIPVTAEGVEIWIHGLPSDAGLRVLWTDGQEAWIYAGDGTRFTSTDRRLEAFDPPGTVRIEIPRTLARVTLGLDGEVLLRKSGGELEILRPVQERSPTEIRFEPPPLSNDGASPGVSNP